MTEIARLEGVPPNMSVSRTTPLPVSTSVDGGQNVVPAQLHIVFRTDGDRLDLLLRPDHVFQRGTKLRGEVTVRHEHHADHCAHSIMPSPEGWPKLVLRRSKQRMLRKAVQ